MNSEVEIFYSTFEKISSSSERATILKFGSCTCMMKYTNIIKNNYDFPIIENDNTPLHGYRCVILDNNPELEGPRGYLISGARIITFVESYIANNGDHLQAELKMGSENSFSRTNANLKRDDCDGFASTILRMNERICQPSFENEQEHFLAKLVVVNIVSISHKK
ncbi:hypothetical protein TVAG_222500 [Trichomonas vaginalis G3]|uniref:Uncharacterized protein n=1 Tax=Trichomonas vaginalis (strain ATCC PRA-98 / G3) TaxID=412133 RepID=A2F5C6_TRIV3|nr:hypothetical protein TVAGG3_1031950 [Trichomonas vaginalis G3]EAX99889.1 hypothetical protein TVAG_222500 [Trichomonas vaginalis G3]KAI5492931.1 hypothetical protein TVAGG3_1031950 [Trichomonas vaginalis G3]|eukprot:XP_001312819.1 hypothetical protein [Trichomonas vaginalis G3]